MEFPQRLRVLGVTETSMRRREHSLATPESPRLLSQKLKQSGVFVSFRVGLAVLREGESDEVRLTLLYEKSCEAPTGRAIVRGEMRRERPAYRTSRKRNPPQPPSLDLAAIILPESLHI
eukprot:1368930-Amorphochlora_amoeboformis.AAC.2